MLQPEYPYCGVTAEGVNHQVGRFHRIDVVTNLEHCNKLGEDVQANGRRSASKVAMTAEASCVTSHAPTGWGLVARRSPINVGERADNDDYNRHHPKDFDILRAERNDRREIVGDTRSILTRDVRNSLRRFNPTFDSIGHRHSELCFGGNLTCMPRTTVAISTLIDFIPQVLTELAVTFDVICRRALNVVVGFCGAFLSVDDSVDEKRSESQGAKAKNQIHLKCHAMNMGIGKPLFKISGVPDMPHLDLFHRGALAKETVFVAGSGDGQNFGLTGSTEAGSDRVSFETFAAENAPSTTSAVNIAAHSPTNWTAFRNNSNSSKVSIGDHLSVIAMSASLEKC